MQATTRHQRNPLERESKLAQPAEPERDLEPVTNPVSAPVSIAVIGAGLIGRKHVDTVRGEPLCRLAAIADPGDGAEAYAADNDVPWFAGYVEMLDRVRPEAAIVATPNVLHVAAGIACAERGVHMLVEKPLADTVEAARQLVDAADRAHVALLVGHHRRYNPVIEKARDIVRSGAIGRVTAISAQWMLLKPGDYFDVAHRREPGGGPVLTNAVQLFDRSSRPRALGSPSACSSTDDQNANRGKARSRLLTTKGGTPDGWHKDSGAHSTEQTKKATASGWIGSALEYYDFFIYATAASLIFSPLFFPSTDPKVAIVASLATYGVGYVARPIGAFFLRHWGDTHGRKTVLLVCMFLMGNTWGWRIPFL